MYFFYFWPACSSVFLFTFEFLVHKIAKKKKENSIGNWQSADLEILHLSLFVNSWDRKEQASIGDFLKKKVALMDNFSFKVIYTEQKAIPNVQLRRKYYFLVASCF